jgi:hypothetical protein
LPEEQKKVKYNLSISRKVDKLLIKYFEKNNIYNKSKFIEELIEKEILKRNFKKK